MPKLKNEELNRQSVEKFKISSKLPVVVVLDNVRSAYNVGSVFRICDAFPIEKLYLCGITGFPPNKEVHKTALGAEDSVEWEYCKEVEELILTLKKENFLICSVEQTTDSIYLNDFIFPQDKKVVFVFGHEVDGVQEKIIALSDFCVEIPQYGTKHSLNISVTAGILMWEINRKINL